MFVLFRPAENKLLRWLLGDWGHVEILLLSPHDYTIFGGSWTKGYIQRHGHYNAFSVLIGYTAVLDTSGIEPRRAIWSLPSLFNCCTVVKKLFGLGFKPITPLGLYRNLVKKGAKRVNFHYQSETGEKTWHIINPTL